MSYPSNTSACISSSLSLPYLYSVTATILALRAATTNGTPLSMSHTSFAKIRAARSLWGETILPQCVVYPRRARREPPRPGPLSDGAAPLPPPSLAAPQDALPSPHTNALGSGSPLFSDPASHEKQPKGRWPCRR